MNERIRELANEAGLQPFEDCGPGYVYKMEKFTELIVKECIDCLHMQLGNQYTPEELLFQSKYRNTIKKHFGVRE